LLGYQDEGLAPSGMRYTPNWKLLSINVENDRPVSGQVKTCREDDLSKLREIVRGLSRQIGRSVTARVALESNNVPREGAESFMLSGLRFKSVPEGSKIWRDMKRFVDTMTTIEHVWLAKTFSGDDITIVFCRNSNGGSWRVTSRHKGSEKSYWRSEKLIDEVAGIVDYLNKGQQ